MQAVIYARISKDREGAGHGVERQRADCQALADSLGWSVVGMFTDNDISAYSGRQRPGYNDMCDALASGKANAVIAWHADRLHRRPIELEGFIDLCDAHHVDVRTVQSGELDLSTASGKMVARMIGAAARHEVEHSIERQKRAKKQAALDGKFRGGRRAFGYETGGMTLRNDEANAIRTGIDSLLTGVSLAQVTREWNAAGLRTSFGNNEFRSIDVRKILLNPRNAGIVLHEGERVGKGSWEAIIDVDTFAAVEAHLCNPSRRGGGNFERKYQGSGTYRCGLCQAPMVSGSQNYTRFGGWRRTYVCSARKHVARDVTHLDAYIDEIVLGVLSRPDAAIRLGEAGTDVEGLHVQRAAIRARLDGLAAMFAKGAIDGPQLKRGTADLQKMQEEVDGQLAAARSASALANLILAGDDLEATWNECPPDVRGKVINALMIVTVLPGPRGRRPGGAYFDPDSVGIEWREG